MKTGLFQMFCETPARAGRKKSGQDDVLQDDVLQEGWLSDFAYYENLCFGNNY